MRLAIPTVIMRGGSSKALFLREEDIIAPGEARDRLIMSLMGSPDRRQIDGLGGGDPATSKVAIIGPPQRPNTHLTYTFLRVELETGCIDYTSICGNITPAVGLYAVEEKLVPVVEPVTKVDVFCTNLNRVFQIEVPVSRGEPLDDGDYTVLGVPGGGARMTMDYAGAAGCIVGDLLPTGSPIDLLDVPRVGKVEVSIVDIGNAHVFVRASDLEMSGTETSEEMDADRALLDCLERIRRAAADRLNLPLAPARPMVAAVGPPASYVAQDGVTIPAEDLDVIVRLEMSSTAWHVANAGTSTVCTGIAARIDGSVVNEVLRPEAHERDHVRVGHIGGVITTESSVVRRGGNLVVVRATLGQTARRIMDGTAYVRVSERPPAWVS